MTGRRSWETSRLAAVNPETISFETISFETPSHVPPTGFGPSVPLAGHGPGLILANQIPTNQAGEQQRWRA